LPPSLWQSRAFATGHSASGGKLGPLVRWLGDGDTKGALMTGWLWTLITILGPVLLIAAIVWAFLRNRNPRPNEIERAERGARELRRQLDEEEARRGEP
jgi:hypothetical protein